MDSKENKINKLLKRTKEVLSSFFLKIFKKRESGASVQMELDKKLVYSLSKSKIPNLKQIKYIGKFLNAKELWLLRTSFVVLFASIIFLGARFYATHLEVMPIEGGEYIEGLIGDPKYINPLYSDYSDVDGDISGLIYSSLLKRDNDGRLINDLAVDYNVSEDGKIYTFKITPDAKWHNNSALTVDDIIFTFNAIKDGRYNSPLRNRFNGVDLEKIDEFTINFVLAEPYAGFLELLTFGVMPQDLWYQISPNLVALTEYNLKPVGSGIYKFKSLVKDSSGKIKTYNLTANSNYYGSKAKITDLTFKFFPNFEEAIKALNEGQINGISYLPREFEKDLVAKDSLNLHGLNLPQATSVFFNQKNNEALKERSVRQALALAIDRVDIINEVLGGDAHLIDGPLLSSSFAYNPENKKYNRNKDEAIKLLTEAGWQEVELSDVAIAEAEKEKEAEDEKTKKEAEEKIVLGPGKWRTKNGVFLKIKITSVDVEEKARVAEKIKASWEEIGVKTEVVLASKGAVESAVIKPRNFETLLYSQMLGADPDLYVLWHSSQAGEGGINLSNYANKDVDQILEEARVATDIEKRKEKYKKFQEIVTNDLPAIFMYSPTYTYIQGKKIKGFGTKTIVLPKDRFSGISEWYVKTGKKLVW